MARSASERRTSAERLRVSILLPTGGDTRTAARDRAINLLRKDYFPGGSTLVVAPTGAVVEGFWKERERATPETDRHVVFIGLWDVFDLPSEEVSIRLATLEHEIWNVYAKTALAYHDAGVAQSEIFVEAWPATWVRPRPERAKKTGALRAQCRRRAKNARR